MVSLCAEAKPAWFDAHNQIAGAARVVAGNVVPGLLTIGDDATPAPRLAVAWGWQSEKVLTLVLPEGLTFTSGRVLDARAVCENLERVRQRRPPPFNWSDFAPIARCEPAGELEVVLKLHSPYAPLPAVLANGLGIVDLALGEPPANVVGAGAYRLDGISPRAYRLVPVDQKHASVDWRFCTSGRARTVRIRAGKADVLIGSEGSSAAAAAGWRSLATPALGPAHLAFNLSRRPTSDIAFRRAVVEAIDRDELLVAGFAGKARAAVAPYPDDSAFPLRVDVSPLARRLRGPYPELELAVGGDAYLPLARAVARMVRGATGAHVRVVSVLNPEWWPAYYLAAEWDLAVQAWTPMPDPHLVYARRYASSGIHNATGYANRRLDRVVREAATVLDLRRRLDLYREAEAARARDLPTVYLAFPHRIASARAGISAPTLRPSWAVDLPDA